MQLKMVVKKMKMRKKRGWGDMPPNSPKECLILQIGHNFVNNHQKTEDVLSLHNSNALYGVAPRADILTIPHSTQ
jgi:hypothetical protein